MNEIIESNNYDSEKLITIGDKRAGESISFQLAQDFYNEITGKSEKIEEDHDAPVIICKSDIEQANYKIHQTLEQYHIVSMNYTISVKYINDSSERYSSIERFSLHAENKGKVVETITLEYRVLVVLPKVSRPQEYKITLDLRSREAEIDSMRKFGRFKYGFPVSIFDKSTTVAFSIEFIDIAVARSLMSTLNDWLGTLERSTMNKYLKAIRSKSSIYPSIGKYIFLLTSLYFALKYSTLYFALPVNHQFQHLGIFILAFGTAIFIMYEVGNWLGKVSERGLDSIYETSYIHISKCDQNLAAEAEEIRKNNLLKSVLSTIITFLFAVLASYVATKLG